jgi:hypothetical protein
MEKRKEKREKLKGLKGRHLRAVGAAHGKMKSEKRKTKRPEGLTSVSHG